jgi:Na+/alanine symporter
MKNKKAIGFVLLAVGIILLAVSLLADMIGIGGGGAFGLKQILGAVAGAVAAIAGLVLALKK